MFRNYNSTLWNSTEQTNHSFCFIQFNKAYYPVIQPYFESNVFFVNTGFFLNSPPPLATPNAFRNMYTHARPTSEYLTNNVAAVGIEVGQPCCTWTCFQCFYLELVASKTGHRLTTATSWGITFITHAWRINRQTSAKILASHSAGFNTIWFFLRDYVRNFVYQIKNNNFQQ